MVNRLKKNDLVVVISGKDKGKEGKILKVFPSKGIVIVSGVNIVLRHMKPSMKQKGGIVRKESPIHLSNVMLKDPVTGKPTRIRIMTSGASNKKKRISVVSGEVIDS